MQPAVFFPGENPGYDFNTNEEKHKNYLIIASNPQGLQNIKSKRNMMWWGDDDRLTLTEVL